MTANGHYPRPPADPVYMCMCGRKCQAGSTGCHSIQVCPVHGLQDVSYPSGEACVHWKTLQITPPGKLVAPE